MDWLLKATNLLTLNRRFVNGDFVDECHTVNDTEMRNWLTGSPSAAMINGSSW